MIIEMKKKSDVQKVINFKRLHFLDEYAICLDPHPIEFWWSNHFQTIVYLFVFHKPMLECYLVIIALYLLPYYVSFDIQ